MPLISISNIGNQAARDMSIHVLSCHFVAKNLLSGIRTIVGETANYTRALSGEEKKRGSKRKELGARSTGFYCPLIKIDD